MSIKPMSDNPALTANGWNEWSRHVLAELQRLSEGYSGLLESENDFKLEVQKNINSLSASLAEEIRKQTEQHRKAYAEDKDKQEKTNTEFRLAILELKIKAGIWGLMGGLIPVVVSLLLMFISKLLNII